MQRCATDTIMQRCATLCNGCNAGMTKNGLYMPIGLATPELGGGVPSSSGVSPDSENVRAGTGHSRLTYARRCGTVGPVRE